MFKMNVIFKNSYKKLFFNAFFALCSLVFFANCTTEKKSDLSGKLDTLNFATPKINTEKEEKNPKLAKIDTNKFDFLGKFHQKRARFYLDKKYGFLDTTYTIVIDNVYDEADDFSPKINITRVKKGDFYGIIDTIGRVVVPFKYKQIGSCKDSLILFFAEEKYGFFNKKGKDILPPTYNWASNLVNGYARVNFMKKWTFINRKGSELAQPQFAGARDFSEHLAGVFQGQKWGFIDTTGRLVIGFEFDKILSDFEKGKAKVEKNNQVFLIDKKGKKTN